MSIHRQIRFYQAALLTLTLAACATRGNKPGDPVASLASARTAEAAGLDSPAEVAAYNQAVADTVAWWQTREQPGGAAGSITVPGSAITLSAQVPKGVYWDKFVAGNSVKLTSVKTRATRDGVGSPQVAYWASNKDRINRQPLLSEAGYSVPLTASLDFPGQDRAVLRFEDPRTTAATRVDGSRHPLAGDFTAPLEQALNKDNLQGQVMLNRFGALFQSGKYLDKLGLIAVEPPQPDKIPVVFVHGLISKPLTWTAVVNKLNEDPVIRAKYQFYFFRYPTGVPVLYSAAKFRDQLAVLDAELAKVHNQHRDQMVLIGHSMGGLLSKEQIQTSGDRLWIGIFGGTPETLKMRSETVKRLRPYMEFTPNPHIERVVFVSTPHRGSKIADFSIVRFLTSRLIKLPLNVLDTTLSVVIQGQEADPVLVPLTAKRLPSSVDNLSPTSNFVKISQTLPISPKVHLHTIAGNKNGLPLDDPRAGDGVVPYTSAHLDGVESELVVKSGHGAHETPEAQEEIRRILRLHVGAGR